MITKIEIEKRRYRYRLLIVPEEYEECVCGRPYFYLASLKKCPKCGGKLIFYGDLVNEVIHFFYHPLIFVFGYPPPFSIPDSSYAEKMLYLGKERIGRKKIDENYEKDKIKEIFLKNEEKKYLPDIIVFLKLFFKELEGKYRIIQEKEKNNKLSEKNPFENLIFKQIEYNQALQADMRFFDSFPVKSIPKERILKDLQNLSYRKRETEMITYSFDHPIEEIGRKFEMNRERIHQIIRPLFLELYQNTKEYKDYKKLEEKHEKAAVKCVEAVKRYYESIKEKAKKINQAID